jgi:uncharacterized DUF497 family protein
MDFDIRFSEEKSQLLKSTRGVSFEEIRDAIESGNLLKDIAHPSHKRPNQRMYVVKHKEYAYAVPYVTNLEKKEIFLKTIYPSRMLTIIYLGGKHGKK